jgi:phosphate uptake regulator
MRAVGCLLLAQPAGEKKEGRMSARKKVRKVEGVTSRSAPLAREFLVVLEDVRSQFKVFGEALQVVNEKVDRLDRHVTSGFERVDREMATRFERVDREMATRFEHVDREMATGFERVDRELGLVKAVVLEHGRELRQIRGGMTRLEAVMEKKVDRDEVEAIAQRVVDRPRSG